MLCACEELLECLALKLFLAFLLKHDVQILDLGVVHALIVDLCQGVKLLLQGSKLGSLLLVLYGWQLAQVGILWVKGEDAYARVGVRVGPCVR